MKEIQNLNKRYETVAWGLLVMLFGVLSLIPGNQETIFVLGIGIVLLGLNAARYAGKLPTSGVTITLGVLASALGLVAVFRSAFHNPPFDVPLFPAFMIVIGIIILGRAAQRAASQ